MAGLLRTRQRQQTLLSAHRFGAGDAVEAENSMGALLGALELGIEYVEFDVQRCLDGTLVVSHSAHVRIGDARARIAALTLDQLRVLQPDVLLYAEVLDAIRGRARAHLDLKMTSSHEQYRDPGAAYEVEATRLAVEALGVDNVIVTTLEDKGVRAVRDWADAHGHQLLVGLSLGRSVRGLPWWEQVRVRVSELRPQLRVSQSHANLVVAKHTLARLGVRAFARRRGLPLLVWTVDTPGALRYWMRPGRAWLVTTNFPRRALGIRAARRL
ncbi:glycerophosphodiester phosphodiesterase [Nocardioides sp. SYSU D00038]|uniref:glycerophosphodiester phosphodiesterase n=1 Tax=Nocardioides sp. SYSU D00038 TaxID=2812554 RepID=UPI00196742AE|nr:glycerophosphodiester phosphodiesterase [Nocardioides sp. SYSU D00038]